MEYIDSIMDHDQVLGVKINKYINSIMNSDQLIEVILNNFKIYWVCVEVHWLNYGKWSHPWSLSSDQVVGVKVHDQVLGVKVYDPS